MRFHYFFKRNDKVSKIANTNPAKITQFDRAISVFAISSERVSRVNTLLKLGKTTSVINPATKTELITPVAQLSFLALFPRTSTAGTQIRTSPTTPLSVASGMFKLAVVKKSVIGPFH